MAAGDGADVDPGAHRPRATGAVRVADPDPRRVVLLLRAHARARARAVDRALRARDRRRSPPGAARRGALRAGRDRLLGMCGGFAGSGAGVPVPVRAARWIAGSVRRDRAVRHSAQCAGLVSRSRLLGGADPGVRAGLCFPPLVPASPAASAAEAIRDPADHALAAVVARRGHVAMSDTVFIAPLRIAAAHPALPGHFPGNPVVPGVVLLQRVAAALKQWRDQPMARFDVKSLAPLLPEQDATIELREDAARVRFAIRRGEDVLAKGVMESTP